MIAASAEEGWLTGIHQCRSPNYNARPACCAIDTLVIHNISLPPGAYGGGYIHSFFCNRLPAAAHPYFSEIAALEVSAHFLIERCGRITQFVSCDQRAWHAGRSHFDGRDNVNDFSLGIELEGTDSDCYTEAQYRQLADLTRELQRRYPALVRERIIGHSDIAPGRKTDPGPAFDWAYFQRLSNLPVQA